MKKAQGRLTAIGVKTYPTSGKDQRKDEVRATMYLEVDRRRLTIESDEEISIEINKIKKK